MDGMILHRIDLCGGSPATDIKNRRKKANECAANRTDKSSGSNNLCHCGRSFRRKGDLMRHSRFCASGTS